MAALQNILPGDAVKARVKWFNVPKGFGFVEPEDGNYDAFLHITTLKRAGVNSLDEGACVLCRIERTAQGAHVAEVLSILDEGNSQQRVEQPSLPEDLGDDCFHLTGTVKWYKPDKGFGFVLADDGLRDVFLHRNCLARCGLSTIEAGVAVEMNVRATTKGREAVEIQFLDEKWSYSGNDEWTDSEAGNS